MNEWHQRDHSPITEEKLVRAVHILADIVENSGSAFRPLYQGSSPRAIAAPFSPSA
jgi:hypothetical protein